jgi:hypothetical protein
VSVIALITLVGLIRGLSGLELLERVALGAVLILVFAIGTAFAGKDASMLAGGSLHLPPVSGAGFGSVLLVALATPLMGLGTPSGPDRELLELVERAAPLLVLPLVLCAVLSQFSAATADTEAGVGNLSVLAWRPLTGRRRYLIVGLVAAALAATLGTNVIIVVASRAFAAYYALQCVVALRTSDRLGARIAYGALAIVLLVITLLAKTAK